MCSAGWSAGPWRSNSQPSSKRRATPFSIRPQHQSRSRGPRTRRPGRDRARPPRYRAVGRRRRRFRSCRTPVDARQPSPLPCASTPPPLPRQSSATPWTSFATYEIILLKMLSCVRNDVVWTFACDAWHLVLKCEFLYCKMFSFLVNFKHDASCQEKLKT